MKKMQNAITAGYLFLILVIFPLYFREYYLAMAFYKWIFYLFVTLFFLGLFVIVSVAKGICGICAGGEKQAGVLQSRIMMPDCMVIAFGVSNLITFLTCPSRQAAWMGTDSWYMGLVAQMLFVITYLTFSFGGASEKAFICFQYAGSAICFFIAVCQRYGKDILLLYYNMSEEVVRDYLSTIGNRSWFAGYVSAVFPMGVYLFWRAQKRKSLYWTGVYVALTFCCIVTMNADSIYPAFFAVLFALTLMSLDSRKQLEKMLYIGDIWVGSCLAMSVLRLFDFVDVRELRGLSKLFLNLPFSIISAVIIFGVTWIYHYFEKNQPEKLNWLDGINAYKWRKYIILGIIVVGLTVILLMGLNTAGVFQSLFGFTIENSYFYFGDEWGDYRGFNWKLAWDLYMDLPLKEKLFGVGQDCFAFYAYSIPEYVSRLRAVWGDAILANAHNEWLNCLVCQGLIGAIFYAGSFLGVAYYCLKKEAMKQESPLVPAIGLCVIGYMVNNIFGYQQASATAVIFIAMGMAMYLKKTRESD